MTIDIQETLSLHAKWLAGEDGGKCAYLYDANLSKANLAGANLSRAYLTGTNLSRANLYDANLSEADLSGANLSRANLSGSNLFGAYLSMADLRGANLRGTNLYRANLVRAKGIVSFGPVGKEKRIGYAVKHKPGPMVQLGCFWGSLDEALAAIEEKYGPDSTYAKFVSIACEEVMK